MENLLFFDKEGKSLNFNYDETLGRYEGELMFTPGSTDTFTTQALYMFEKVSPLEFEDRENLTIRRFQLFNERGVVFRGSVHQNQIITRIEPAVLEPGFSSRWIYGDNFDRKFPPGTIVRFEDPIFDLTSPTITYQVVSVKRGAFLIIGPTDNILFDQNHQWSVTAPYQSSPRVSALNVIEVSDYVDPVSLTPTLSYWNEQYFYDMIYPGRKLNLVNSVTNDGYVPGGNYEDVNIVTVSAPYGASMSDVVTVSKRVGVTDLPTGQGIGIEIELLTDKILAYEGQLEFFQTLNIGPNTYENVLRFSGPVPSILSPGMDIEVFSGGTPIINQGILRIAEITDFLSVAEQRSYLEGELVIWKNRIYICILPYVWVPSPEDEDDTLVIPFLVSTPDDTDHWLLSDMVIIEENLQNELLLDSDVFLTDNVYNFYQEASIDSRVTLASLAERWAGTVRRLNIELEYRDNVLTATPMFSGQWVECRFYTDLNITIGTVVPIYRRIVETQEVLSPYSEGLVSENFSYDLVIRSISETGLDVNINEQSYPLEYSPVFTGNTLDNERTVHNNILQWVSLYGTLLLSLGILVTPGTRDVSSVYYNTISFVTEYPNVPLELSIPSDNTDYYIPDTDIIFYPFGLSGQMIPAFGPTVDVRVNNRVYPVANPGVMGPGVLSQWVSEHGSVLFGFGIEVVSNGNTLRFRTRSTSFRCDVVIRAGATPLPGDMNTREVRQYRGSYGTVITSNSFILGTPSVPDPNYLDFVDAGLSTGMVTGLNNTDYPLQNKEYNIVNLGQYSTELSYEGPFWGLTGICDTLSPFTSIAFNAGFSQSGCIPSPTPSVGGQFSSTQFSNAFSIVTQNPISYTLSTITTGLNLLTDILHTQDKIFILSDVLTVYDATTGDFLSQIALGGSGIPVMLLWDQYSYNVLCLQDDNMTAVDIFSLTVMYFTSLTVSATDMSVTDNGDIWVAGVTDLTVLDSSGAVITTFPGQVYRTVYNRFENTVYVSTPTSIVRYSAQTRVVLNTYAGLNPTTDKMVYEPVRESVLFWDNTGLLRIENGVLDTNQVINTPTGSQNWLLFEPFTDSGTVIVSSDTPSRGAVRMSDLGILYSQTPPSDTGSGIMAFNVYDGGVYLSNQDPVNPSIIVFNPSNGSVVDIFPSSATTGELAYIPQRRSTWVLVPGTGEVFEIQSSFTVTTTQTPFVTADTDETYYGSLSPDFILRDNIWIHTREYIRRPRFGRSSGPSTSLLWKWFSDDIPEFFLYDWSGKMLPEEGSLSYTGPRPLTEQILNRNANRNPEKRGEPGVQQTIFPVLSDTLDTLDDPVAISELPVPIETFIGYNSGVEGPIRSILTLWFREDVDFTLNNMVSLTDIITLQDVDTPEGDRYGLISLDTMSDSLFIDRGLRPGQHLALFIRDVSNVRNQYLSPNSGILVTIRQVFPRQIVVDYFKSVDRLETETTTVQDYPREGDVTYLSVRFKVWDREIGRFTMLAQSEDEDERYRILLSNSGHLVSADYIQAYREYDIKEDGIDWVYLNRKRKEMLMLRSIIFPYVGAYKSIINAIGHFGYDDLELYEYYRNVNENSPNFRKLFKVETPGAFQRGNNDVIPFDDLLRTFPNSSFEDTRLFNLTYRITDREGNNVLSFSIEEVQKKLELLKKWLKENIIPVSHRILDITGRLDVTHTTHLTHIKRDVRNIKFNETLTPVSFRLTDIYLSPVNSGSTVYTCKTQFYVATEEGLPDTFTLNLRTYGARTEWFPLKNYSIGEQVSYFGRLYESVVNNNRANDPRRFEGVSQWELDAEYLPGDNVAYRGRIYVYTGAGPTGPSTVTPLIDTVSWADITLWIEIELKPVQSITEHRNGDDREPFLFTLDSNTDPYVVIEVISYNGRGAVYCDRKNYFVQGTGDIQELEAVSELTVKRYRDLFLSTVYTGQ